MTLLSVAMAEDVDDTLALHLLREDRQEDLCFATWRPSTSATRRTSIVQGAILPVGRERAVHGNASFRPEYVLRAAQEAGKAGLGLTLVHSHPGGRGWQGMSSADLTAEARIANIARQVTGLDLLGMTLAGGDRSWSARVWQGAGKDVFAEPCTSVRVIGYGLRVSFNEQLAPAPSVGLSQERTVHAWGEATQADLARLHVAVVGLGSVGMSVFEALARTGIECISAFDFDSVEARNLDRLRGADPLDAALRRSKVHVSRRVAMGASTALQPRHEFHELSVCEPAGLKRVLDADIIMSCVDRPWPRHVLNTIAYADLIPVIEGGVRLFRNPDDSFQNAYWRTTVVRPGRPCLACLGQYDPAAVQVERDGSLDDPTYLANLPADSPLRSRENVAALSVSVTASLLHQFICFVTKPSRFGDPGPLKFSLRDATAKKVAAECDPGCPHAASVGGGDERLDPSARHHRAKEERQARTRVPAFVRIGRRVDDALAGFRLALAAFLQ